MSMDEVSKTPAVDALQNKGLRPPPPPPTGAVSDTLSLPSYKDYPAHRPFIDTLVHHTRRKHQSHRPSSPSKAFPESSSAAILSALRNLQEKIKRLELEKGDAERGLQTAGRDTSHTSGQRDKVPPRDMTAPSNCNQVLITHLAAAESRCVKLERQLDQMRRMLRSAKADRNDLVKQQVSTDRQPDTVHVTLEKLEQLEREYRKLTRTQGNTEVKIRELEMKLQEEEHQRKLIQDKAVQLQTGLDANRILLQSVSPYLSPRQAKEKKFNSQKLSPQSSYTEPHYRLSLRDVPFVAGTSVGCSHSVRANVQSVLSLLKRHQPHLCNSRVLSDNAHSSSSSSTASGEELSELLRALQEELRLMSLEHEELMRQLGDSVCEQERRELQREQEGLLLKMERKGDQISKLFKHKTQIKKLKREANSRRTNKNDASVTTTVTTRGRSGQAVKFSPGERSRRNLRLLRDMKALQTSLRT